MRNLASIQQISKLEPIEGKDRIELATILGWEVIVEKGQYKVGDSCVYIEIDSLLPVIPEFEFLRSRCYSKKYNRFRIRTLKLGEVYSQGIVFPIATFSFPSGYQCSIGRDVTDILDIVKYDPEAEKAESTPKQKRGFLIRWLYKWGILKAKKNKSSKWPEFLPKTDETRCVCNNTIITTNKYGKITIEDLFKKNDIKGVKVLSLNLNNNIVEYDDILEINKSENNNDWCKVTIDNKGEIIATQDHYFWLPELKCYRKLHDLKEGDCILYNE